MAGEPVIRKEVLLRWTNKYLAWVEALHAPTPQRAESKVRKEDFVRLTLRRMERSTQNGEYFIPKSMAQQGQTFRSAVPRFYTAYLNYRILACQRSRYY